VTLQAIGSVVFIVQTASIAVFLFRSPHLPESMIVQ